MTTNLPLATVLEATYVSARTENTPNWRNPLKLSICGQSFEFKAGTPIGARGGDFVNVVLRDFGPLGVLAVLADVYARPGDLG